MLAPDTFLNAASELGIAFDDGDVERLGQFLEFMLETNKTHNLTAITDPVEAWERHILDALTLLPVILQVEARSLIDIGSGGGVPGIPLAIALPDVRMTLVEATGKKARFLEDAARKLLLENVEVVNDRAEAIGRDRERFREAFDVCTARAVGPLRVLLELTVPLVRPGGLILAIKGERAGEEVEAAKHALHALHAHVIDTIKTPTGTIVVIEKQRRTPKLYPRRPGEPKRAPL